MQNIASKVIEKLNQKKAIQSTLQSLEFHNKSITKDPRLNLAQSKYHFFLKLIQEDLISLFVPSVFFPRNHFSRL
jgi:hypothetical protein